MIDALDPQWMPLLRSMILEEDFKEDDGAQKAPEVAVGPAEGTAGPLLGHDMGLRRALKTVEENVMSKIEGLEAQVDHLAYVIEEKLFTEPDVRELDRGNVWVSSLLR